MEREGDGEWEGGREGRKRWRKGPPLSLSFQLAQRCKAQSFCRAPKIEGPFCRPLGTQREEGGDSGRQKGWT